MTLSNLTSRSLRSGIIIAALLSAANLVQAGEKVTYGNGRGGKLTGILSKGVKMVKYKKSNLNFKGGTLQVKGGGYLFLQRVAVSAAGGNIIGPGSACSVTLKNLSVPEKTEFNITNFHGVGLGAETKVDGTLNIKGVREEGDLGWGDLYGSYNKVVVKSAGIYLHDSNVNHLFVSDGGIVFDTMSNSATKSVHLGDAELSDCEVNFSVGTIYNYTNGYYAWNSRPITVNEFTIGDNVSLKSIDLGYWTSQATLIIVDNNGTKAIQGKFKGLPEGSTVLEYSSRTSWTISYKGGDGNDISITYAGSN